MPTDFTSNPADDPMRSESETPMFAPIPAWERGKKRRGFGGRTSRVEPEPRSFAADPVERDVATGAAVREDLRPYETRSEAMADSLAPTPATDTAFAATPAYATRTAVRKNSAAPVAIAAGIILLGGLAAAGWYYTQPHGQGVAELTPGSATTTTTATAGAPTPGEQQLAQADAAPPAAAAPPPPAAHARTTTTTTVHSAPAPAARTTVTRTHRATSASDVSADASTTAPVRAAPAPAPTPAAPPSAAAAPAPPLVLNVPLATTQAAPVQTAPAPTQAAPQTATPPVTQTPPN